MVVAPLFFFLVVAPLFFVVALFLFWLWRPFSLFFWLWRPFFFSGCGALSFFFWLWRPFFLVGAPFSFFVVAPFPFFSLKKVRFPKIWSAFLLFSFFLIP